MKIPTKAFLQQRRAAVLADLRLKVDADDWHGTADAAMDLREIDAQLPLLEDAPVSSDARPAPVVHEYVMSSSEAPDA